MSRTIATVLRKINRHFQCQPLVMVCQYRNLSSGEVATALRPFYFSVHPDLFEQYPEERAVNENSLKHLNEHIEAQLRRQPARPSKVSFFLRAKAQKVSQQQLKRGFRFVEIPLSSRDVRTTVYSILNKCDLPTSYVDKIAPAPVTASSTMEEPFTGSEIWRKMNAAQAERRVQEARRTANNLTAWLDRNIVKARELLSTTVSIREEVARLRVNLCRKYQLNDVIWDCGWGARHFRGCMQSFKAMATHHEEAMYYLHNRTLVFGRESGVSLDGHVILNSGEVRNNWLDVIKNIPYHDRLILRIPAVEKAVSKALRDIQVVHRKFQPKRMGEKYESNLRRLVTSLGDYQGRGGFPKTWPDSLAHLQLVVEADAGPLMVSPTGQLIVPASCPPFLLVSFISDHMEEAQTKLKQYESEEYLEQGLIDDCMLCLGLSLLEKEDNVTSEQMMHCCRRLIQHAPLLQPIVKGMQIWITNYYSLLSDGEICIPWNWQINNEI